MKIKHLITSIAVACLLIIVLPCLSFAACTDPAGPNVDWSYCNKEFANLNGANLTGANLYDAARTATEKRVPAQHYFPS
jgi:hypothetical protein